MHLGRIEAVLAPLLDEGGTGESVLRRQESRRNAAGVPSEPLRRRLKRCVGNRTRGVSAGTARRVIAQRLTAERARPGIVPVAVEL